MLLNNTLRPQRNGLRRENILHFSNHRGKWNFDQCNRSQTKMKRKNKSMRSKTKILAIGLNISVIKTYK